MKKTITTLALLVFVANTVASDAALARSNGRSGASRSGQYSGTRHHHRSYVRSGVFFGAAVGGSAFWPYWDYPRYVVAAPPQPVYYTEQAEQNSPGAGEWFYCSGANGYFPAVMECPGGWVRIPSQPQ